MALHTRLTSRYDTAYPLAQAGMAFAGERPELAAAVCRAGGIGSIGVGFMHPDTLRHTISTLRDAAVGPFNINFITYFGNDDQIAVCVEERPPIVSFHWGHPPLEQVTALLDAGIDLWVQVGTVEDGVTAAGYGASVIIPQGWEAGGHNYGGMGTVAFVPAMVDAIGDGCLVLASGGVADGRGVAAALAIGADGVWVGTRLVASTEAHVHPEHHRRLVLSAGDDTVRSGVFGPEMPDFNPMRLHRNRVVAEFTDRLADVPTDRSGEPVVGETVFLDEPYTKRRFDVMLPTPPTTGDYEEMPWLMGQGVGLVHDIRPAGELIAQMMADAESRLAALTDSVVRR